MKISVIIGTRPEAIKLAPLVLAFRKDCRFDCQVCCTAQHRHMVDQALEVFGIIPDEDLNLMVPDQSLAHFTSHAISALDGYLRGAKPDVVLVQGDTATVLSAALASFYLKIPVGHVEAGLRTGNLYAPWPEEGNRVLTTRIATFHFAPTEGNRDNLLREGIPRSSIFVTGNTGVDALFIARDLVRLRPPGIPGLPEDWRTRWAGGPLVLITGHRRENFGRASESISEAIANLAELYPAAHFVYPVHLNPNVRGQVNRILARANENIHLIEPLAYVPFVALLESCHLVLSDSGGIQEEAPSLGKPVLVTREVTERPEALRSGMVKLVGSDKRTIIKEASRFLSDPRLSLNQLTGDNPFGDGKASQRILEILADFKAGKRPENREEMSWGLAGSQRSAGSSPCMG